LSCLATNLEEAFEFNRDILREEDRTRVRVRVGKRVRVRG
jgi:hypothetical protein